MLLSPPLLGVGNRFDGPSCPRRRVTMQRVAKPARTHGRVASIPHQHRSTQDKCISSLNSCSPIVARGSVPCASSHLAFPEGSTTSFRALGQHLQPVLDIAISSSFSVWLARLALIDRCCRWLLAVVFVGRRSRTGLRRSPLCCRDQDRVALWENSTHIGRHAAARCCHRVPLATPAGCSFSASTHAEGQTLQPEGPRPLPTFRFLQEMAAKGVVTWRFERTLVGAPVLSAGHQWQ